MAYPTLKKLNEQVDKIANQQEPDEAGMVAICMYNLRRVLKQSTVLYIGNGNYTFMITSEKTKKCDIRYIKPELQVGPANILSKEIEKFLKNPERKSGNVHTIFDFLRNAQIGKEYFK